MAIDKQIASGVARVKEQRGGLYVWDEIDANGVLVARDRYSSIASAPFALLQSDIDAASAAGEFEVSAPTPQKTVEQLTHEFTDAVQAHLDNTVKIRGYDSMLSCATYATSTSPIFSAEAAAAIAWRDTVWTYCYTELAKVLAGQRTVPVTADVFLTELPVLVW